MGYTQLTAFVNVSPLDLQACDRLERLVERDAVGIKSWQDLGFSVRGGRRNLPPIDDDRLAPIFEARRTRNRSHFLDGGSERLLTSN